MNPLRQRMNIRKRFLPQMLPYCILIFLLLLIFAVLRYGFYDAKSDFNSSRLEYHASPDYGQLTKAVDYYYMVFQNLIAEGYLFPTSKALCINRIGGPDVIALKNIGVTDAIGISESAISFSDQETFNHPLKNNTFDFEFFGYNSWFNWSIHPFETAAQICRTLKVGGYLVVHMVFKDEYSLNSFVNLFTCCTVVASRNLRALEFISPSPHEVILKKENEYSSPTGSYKCMIPQYRRKLVNKLEPLVMEEPQDSWSALGGNENSSQYLSAMVDLTFKERYIYVDLGSRNYDSSIGSWFKKQYPKQNKNFEIYAIKADEYSQKKGLTLVPYTAWIRNETLFYEIDREPTDVEQRWEQMGRIQSGQSSSEHKDYVDKLYKVEALDLSDWLIRTVSERDFVVMKMDVEGTEVDLMKSLVETGAACLIDELFLECHYDHFVKCCSGQRINRYKMTYAQCLDLFVKLRKDGYFVHQWW